MTLVKKVWQMATISRSMTATVYKIEKGPTSQFPIRVYAKTGDGPDGIIIPWPSDMQVPLINSTVRITAIYDV